MSFTHVIPKMRVTHIVCVCLSYISYVHAANDKAFPPGFKLGVASSAYQVEGAWKEDGKGLNIFDALTHRSPSVIKDNSTGDIACDSYHKYKEDIELVKELGMDYYRFSLSWARILPTGYANDINQLGIQHYKDVLAALKEANIEPVVTIFHWDLPVTLQRLGGWTNEVLIDAFIDYADIVFREFGDSVKIWTTFNEPHQFCTTIVSQTYDPKMSGINEYLCAHNVIKAHAKAYRLYERTYKPKQGGKISMNLDANWMEPDSPSSEVFSQRKLLFDFGWFAHPLVYGQYPSEMVERVRERSLAEGFAKSRLPEFTPQERLEILGSYDYIGLNHYTTNLVRKMNDTSGQSRYNADIGIEMYQDPSWEPAASTWLKVVPWGFRKLLNWIRSTYLNPEIFVSENGYSDNGALDNPRRTNYYETFMQAMLDAIHKDKVRVSAYTVWSLLDSFEWGDGYTVKFGLYQVDFNDPNRPRTAKSSVQFIQNVTKTRSLP